MNPALRQIIKNADYAICKHCAYFREQKGNVLLGRCTKFGEKNVIHGAVRYAFANDARNNEELCGITGKYFIENIKLLE
jgi:hypothetical protein